MNNRPRRGPGPRPPWPPRARAAAVITVMAAAALLAAACSGSPSSTGSGSSPNAGSGGSPSAGGSATSQLLAYSRCMRSHGVPNFPDPDSNGQIPKEAVGSAAHSVSTSQFQAAGNACANLAPYGLGGQAPITAQEQQYYLRAAACMRSHGFTNLPDPVFSGGGVHFPIPSNIDSNSTRFTQARQICSQLIPAGLPDSGRSGGRS
jgi:hypothetical protein